jgi:hypothetical protein
MAVALDESGRRSQRWPEDGCVGREGIVFGAGPGRVLVVVPRLGGSRGQARRASGFELGIGGLGEVRMNGSHVVVDPSHQRIVDHVGGYDKVFGMCHFERHDRGDGGVFEPGLICTSAEGPGESNVKSAHHIVIYLDVELAPLKMSPDALITLEVI